MLTQINIVSMLDIVIISVPGVISRLPPAAPALLKASVEKNGFTCKTMDFNIQFYQESVNHGPLETYFSTELNPEQRPAAELLIKKWTADIVSLNPKFIGISVFTYQNRVATRLFCEEIRRQSSAKIILGGQGLSDGGIEGSNTFGSELVNAGLADFWIRSEGEISLVELLKNNIEYPGINSNSFMQIDDLDSLEFPDYSDYPLHLYERQTLPVTGSRGCVRSCSFCDIHEHWKYRYRTGQSMANEILYLSDKYQIYDFAFSDSLINGNLKEFKKFIKILAERNKQSEKKISWRSQFIVRGSKEVNEEYWQNIADSGGHTLAIGVETGSDRVRNHMNKKFSSQDLDYTMSMLDKYNITCNFLMIVGYPTETDEDFQDTLDMFSRYQPLFNRIITNVGIGATLGILPGTPLYKNSKINNIELDKYENNWVAHDNPELTLERRIERRVQLHNHLVNLGLDLNDSSSKYMLEILKDNLDMFNQRLNLKKMIRIKQVNN
jgi:radical SAM superfamily enzyme YgiQ (UPF0313 family)